MLYALSPLSGYIKYTAKSVVIIIEQHKMLNKTLLLAFPSNAIDMIRIPAIVDTTFTILMLNIT